MKNVLAWRKKRWNRRCAYCLHCKGRGYLINGVYTRDGRCEAKRKRVNMRVPRPMCALFRLDVNE